MHPFHTPLHTSMYHCTPIHAPPHIHIPLHAPPHTSTHPSVHLCTPLCNLCTPQHTSVHPSVNLCIPLCILAHLCVLLPTFVHFLCTSMHLYTSLHAPLCTLHTSVQPLYTFTNPSVHPSMHHCIPPHTSAHLHAPHV